MSGNADQSYRRAPLGFTLLELVVTVTVVAILSGLAIPEMTNVILKHRVQDTATDFFSALFKARSEALKRVGVVTLAPISPLDWTSGWQITDASSKVIDSHSPTARLAIATTPTSLPNIVYGPVGRITSPTGGEFKLEFSASNGGYSCKYTVYVDPSGRPRETSTGMSGAENVSGGGVPSC